MAKLSATRRGHQAEFAEVIGRFKKLYPLDERALALLDRWALDERAEDVWAKVRQLSEGQGRQALPQTLVSIVLEAHYIAEWRQELDHGIKKARAAHLQSAKQAEELGHLFAELTGEDEPTSDSAKAFARNSRDYGCLSKRAAKVLRAMAAAIPSMTAGARMSWSDRGGSAERTAFMSRVAHHLSQLCGRPCYSEIATLTEIAFPGHDISLEQVRNATARPTTRAGRKPTKVTDRCTGGQKI